MLKYWGNRSVQTRLKKSICFQFLSCWHHGVNLVPPDDKKCNLLQNLISLYLSQTEFNAFYIPTFKNLSINYDFDMFKNL